MKKYIYLILMLPLLLVSACYEGTDMGELFDSLYKETEIEITQSESNSQFSAVIEFSLEAAKYDSEIKIYYTSRRLVDPYPNGTVIDVAKITRQNMDETKSYTVKLDSLDPDTEYRYVIVSSDPSGHTVISKEYSFSTQYMNLETYVYDASIYRLGVESVFYNIPEDSKCGYIIGSDSTLTIENCSYNKTLDVSQYYYNNRVVLNDLTPSTDYYFRAYVISQGRVIYGRTSKGRTDDLNVSLDNLTAYLTNFSEAQLECEVFIMNNDYYSELNSYKDFEYGFELSKSADFQNAKDYYTEPDYYRMNLNIYNLEPGTLYYMRAFADHDGDRIYSETKQFKTRVDRLCGDVDSLYINEQFVYFSLVKAGTFMMGATPEQAAYAREDEYPAHEVNISEDFYISQTEITNSMIYGVSSHIDTPYRTYWWEAMEYARALQAKFNFKQIALPTEAEWEYAARGGHLHPAQTLYAGSNVLNKVAFVVKDTTNGQYMGPSDLLPFTDYVRRRAPNALGIYDMSGNAAEWTRDAYRSDFYSMSPATAPWCSPKSDKETYVVRGGGAYTNLQYFTNSDYRVSARNHGDESENAFSFRIIIRNNK